MQTLSGCLMSFHQLRRDEVGLTRGQRVRAGGLDGVGFHDQAPMHQMTRESKSRALLAQKNMSLQSAMMLRL